MMQVETDQALSEITKMLYGYNLIVNLENDEFFIIEGTGLERTVSMFRRYKKFSEASIANMSMVPPAYIEAMKKIVSMDTLFRQRGRTGYLGGIEYPVRYPGSKEYEWHEVNMFFTVSKDGKQLLNLLGRNVTREHEEKQQLVMAQAANEAKSQFLSSVSHDVRTPLNGILGMATIAGMHLNEPEKVKDCLDKILGAGNHLLSLINDILDLSKIESGNFSLKKEAFSLRELLDNMASMLSSQVAEKKLNFSVEIGELAHDFVEGDQMRLQQVFTNIASNAVKYTPVGGSVRISFREKPLDSKTVTEYEFVCQDSGFGMSHSTLENLFKPFERAKDKRVQKIQGTGLGMAITRNIIRMMDGDIGVESKLNRGSTFTVTFRMKMVRGEVEPHRDIMLQEFAQNDFSDRRILLVEDNELNREIAATVLEETGAKVECAENGQIAVTKVKESPKGYYDLVLMDIKMPVMDGLEAARAIRRLRRKDAGTLPIVAMSANAFAEDVNKSKAAGMNEHLAKPIDLKKLLAVMQRYWQEQAEP